MKILFSLFLICLLYSCASSNSDIIVTDTNNILAAGLVQKPAATANAVTGKWNLIPAMASDTAAGKIPFLNFDTTSHRVNGNTGCNSFAGAYIVAGDSLVFSKNMMSTKMACPGYDEAAFLKNLLRVNRFVVNGDTLELQADKTPLSYWLKSK